MKKTVITVLILLLTATLFIPNTFAQEKITGPWLWMIAPTEPGLGGAFSIDIDSLAVASDGTVTEADIAANGANAGDRVGNFVWTLGAIAATGLDNINECLNRIGMTRGNVDDHSSYALLRFEASTAQRGVTMRVGSDDAIKVWLNGVVVHNHPVDRGASDFQDTFPVNVVTGENLLLVKVSERGGDWSMFVGMDTADAPVREPIVEPPTQEPVQPPIVEIPVRQPQQFDKPIVRLIYFVPKDVQPQPDINAKLDTHIKGVQRFLADEMERHGFGRKTFQFETDVHGNALVHHLKGQAADAYYREQPFSKVSDELLERFGRLHDIYLVALDSKSEILEGFGELCGVQPQASTYGWNEGGAALIPVRCLEDWFRHVTAHELLHVFGLGHDFRDNYVMGGGANPNRRLSDSAAEWLDVHRAFNAGQTAFNEQATIEMLPPSLASPPNAIRLRFRVNDADGLHQAQVLQADHVFTLGNLEMISYQRLDGTSRTVEFVTTALVPQSPSVTLQVIDVRGHFMRQSFPIDIAPLLPPATTVSIPDENLAAAVRETLKLPPDDTLTTQTLLELTHLVAPNREIRNLTGLEHAHNLRYLDLGAQERNGKWRNSNVISDLAPLSELTHLKALILARPFFLISDLDFLRQPPPFKVVAMPDPNLAAAVREALEMPPNEAITTYTMLSLEYLSARNRGIRDLTGLEHAVNLKMLDLAEVFIDGKGAVNSNTVTDISPLQPLTQLKQLFLAFTSVSDVTPLQELTQLEVLWLYGTLVSDVSPLVGLNLTGTSWDSIGLYLGACPLSYVSIHTHIPAMQAKGIEVDFDNVAHPALLKVSGDGQEGTGGSTLPNPFVVEAMDEYGNPIVGKTVQFALLAGGGTLSATSVETDAQGKAQITLTLGPSAGVNKVKATSDGIQSWVLFNAVATEAAPQLAADVNGDGLVDLADLAIVAQAMGKPVENPRADVNADGVVDGEDFAQVAANLGEGAAAAPSSTALPAGFTREKGEWALALLHAENTGSPAFRRGIAKLEGLLALLVPEKTLLLANYPNPFNPETWIPYQLATPADVTLTIYASNGAVVRTLVLGHRRAGSYASQSRAAYWDGRNEIGERVASGVYFYTLQAGDFSATRKMLILK